METRLPAALHGFGHARPRAQGELIKVESPLSARGENYPRLFAIKYKYKPDGPFFLHHGVGSEDWSADGFTRLK